MPRMKMVRAFDTFWYAYGFSSCLAACFYSCTNCVKRVFSYNDALGWSLNAVAVVSMIVSGALLPLMNIVFGKFINSFNEFAAGQLSPQGYRDHVASYSYVNLSPSATPH